MSCESYDLRLTTLSPIHIGSGKSYNCCEFVPAKAKSKGQIVKIIKRVNLTNYYSSLSDDRKDTFLASLTNSNFELKQFDKKIKKDFVRYQCIDNSRVDFINEVQEHIKTSDKLYIPGSSIKGAIRTAIFYDLLTEEDMDKIGRDISSNRRNNSFLSNDLLKKHFTSGFGNDAQYNIFRFMQVADTTTTNLPRIEQVLAVMATDDRRKNQFYSRHGKVVKSYLETIGANKNLEEQLSLLFNDWFVNCTPFKNEELIKSEWGVVPESWKDIEFGELIEITSGNRPDEKSEDKTSEFNIPLFGASKIMGYTKEYSYNEDILIIGRVGTHGVVQRVNYPCFPSDNTFVIKSDYYGFVYQLLKRIDYDSLNTGSTQPLITQKSLKTVNAVLPDEKILSKFEMISKTIFDKIQLNNDEISKLTKLRDTLLPKLMSGEIDVSKINCDLELKYNYMKYLFNQIHTPMSKSVV